MKFSIILTTKNNKRTITKCLNSIISQINENCELIIVDNFSDDGTYEIMKNLTNNTKNIILLQNGPERHIQRGVGFDNSTGDYIYFIDSDMYLPDGFIDEVINNISHNKYKCFIVPEKNTTGKGYRTKVKAFEREFYQGDDLTEAARIFERNIYIQVGGFDPNMISCEDRELTERVRKLNEKIGRLKSSVEHDEGEITLSGLLKKKMYYGGESISYIQNGGSGIKNFFNLFKRLYFFRPVFYTKWRLYKNRTHLIPGLISMLTLELIFGGFGLIKKTISKFSI